MKSTRFNLLSLLLGVSLAFVETLWLRTFPLAEVLAFIGALAGVHNIKRGSYYFANKKNTGGEIC